jgi:hypothetical protein
LSVHAGRYIRCRTTKVKIELITADLGIVCTDGLKKRGIARFLKEVEYEGKDEDHERWVKDQLEREKNSLTEDEKKRIEEAVKRDPGKKERKSHLISTILVKEALN